ncbi:peroxidase family protein [Methylobacterium sp. WL8]|uniref:peroxidase family protein n=1 Tax=Methylobacterium sp. WL8 TaxID=2603899 RepID=UPI0011C81F14|nr:peroxidase family protein [Methylobacterium sp. WL8]TXN81504.1 calcium-binding protein [Methylobacterium sp. WL8]
MSVTFTVDTNDLRQILAQIRIAEEYAAPGNTRTLQEIIGPDAALLPMGLRAVDGSNNNLLPGQSLLGAADQPFPRLLPAQYTTGTGSFDTNGPAPGGLVINNEYSATGTVVDTSIRTASNLIVDMSPHNPAAVAAWFANPIAQAAYADAHGGDSPPQGYIPTATDIAFIPNQSPDIGLSPPFNGWMTLFGQFFDHGLDLATKGGNGSVIVPLMPDDPLIAGADGVLGNADDLPASQQFMVLTRATPVAGPGADGVLGTADDIVTARNTTTPWIDQNQTYTSHPSHQVFLREYTRADITPGDNIDNPVTIATGNLLNGGADGRAIANWAEVKAQAKAMLGIELVDTDIHNVPVLMTDPYGKFIPGAHGYAQMLMQPDATHPTTWFKEGTAEGIRTTGAVMTGHAFLDDIAHTADPIVQGRAVAADADALTGNAVDFNPQTGANLAYDNELLDRHFITGDGRGNENIGLTAVHTIFHSEHNRLVEANKQTILASGDRAFINEWLRVDLGPNDAIPTTPEGVAALQWDGERLFQAAKFVTEMQYQHLVFEEFARTVQPNVDPFVFTNSADIDPAITAEFAHVVYRFGHSMLTDTIDRVGFDMQPVDADTTVAGTQELGLIEAFLNPLAFTASGVDTEAAAGAIIRGMTRQIGNEIDEFIVDALRNNLLGLPLDLATLNIARSREQGVPTLNEARAEFYAMTADAKLKPYTSWIDFAQNIKNPVSVINFIAAYGDHDLITQETTLAGKRAAATALVFGVNVDVPDDPSTAANEAHTISAPTDRLDFLNGTGAWTAANSGLNDVDFWIGGLAEEKMEFGGMLGNTFNFVFETQMENLQNGDRFYYLSRTQGMNLLNELEANTFSALVQRNTDLGDEGSSHLNGSLFGRADHVLELNQVKQVGDDPTQDDLLLQILDPKVVRLDPGADVDGDGHADGGMLKFSGGEHVVLGGTEGNDILIGDKGIDTLWGDGGDDYLNGGMESDQIFGGDGDDVIEDPFGDEFIRGGEGNDAISSGPGLDILFGGGGKDFITHSTDPVEVFAGRGDDFVLGGSAADNLMGNEGNDWIEGGEGFDGLSGENSQLFFNSIIIGHDVLNGQGNDTDYDGESGDDIMVQGPGIQRNNGMLGFDWVIQKGDPNDGVIDLGISRFVNQQALTLRDRNDAVEAASGWKHDDTLIGTEKPTGAVGDPAGGIVGGPATDSMLLSQNVALIDGLEALLKLTPGAVRGQTVGVDATPFADLAPDITVFDPQNGGDILLGGAGSDTFNGKAGNDIIDGDRWLNVRISIRDAAGTEIATADSLAGQMYKTPAGLAAHDPEDLYLDGMLLQTALMSRAVNPGQLNIVRELVDAGAGADVDTAIFSDVRANYTVTNLGDGSFQVSHTGFAVTPTLKLSDGIDTLHNIERAQFADQSVFLTNVPATGAPTIDDTSPTELAALRANVAGIADLNGLPTTFAFQWQSLGADGVTWTNIAGATGQNFTPQQAQVGFQVRVAVSFTDQGGYSERVVSAPTDVVGDNIVDNGLGNTINGTAGADRILGNGGNDIVNAGAGDDFVDGGAGNDVINGAAGNDALQGGTGNDVVNAGAGDDVVTWNGGVALGPITLVASDGRDVVNGGTEGPVGDTFVANGTLGAAETFRVYTTAAWGQVAGNNVATLSAGTEIVVTRSVGAGAAAIIAELQEIEEIRIGTATVSSPNPPTNAGAGDSVFLIGNFSTTSLNLNTVTIDGTEGNDTVDISGLTSAHRIVFHSNGGADTIVGTLRPQDVIDLAPGTTLADYVETQANGMTILTRGTHSITFASSGTPTFDTVPATGGTQPGGGTVGDGTANGGGTATGGGFALTPADLAGIKALVTGQAVAGGDDDANGASGVRELSGVGNNLTHPGFGAADQPFIRLTEAHYGAFDPATGNNALNPLFTGLDPRAISNVLGTQEADLPHQANGANIFFMAFGQYFDHGLDFLPKSSTNGTVEIGGPGSVRSPTSDNPVDLTRGEVSSIDANGVPQHLNKTSPFVDQNQAYGSHELVGQFLRESDGHQGVGAHLLAGLPDPSDPAFNLLPTLRALIQHHWEANTIFHDPSLPGGSISFRDYYSNFATPGHAAGTLVDPATGAFDPGIVSAMAANFMGSGNALLLDTNPFVNLLDHFVAGDGRANENVSLTAMHTIWARNHNFHVDNLVESGFQGTPEEVFQAAKMINEAEYQRVIFTEFADHLIGGMKGNGSHGFGGYDASVDARISEEFASAVYRVGHSLIGESLTVLGPDGQPRQVQLVDAFLNPTNDAGAFKAPLPPGYVPQPGYAQLGANAILAGVATQPAEEVDFNIVDAVRNDLVRINADLFAFNVARGRDVGLGTLNQVRADLQASSDPYVHEAVGFAGDLRPYASWSDFQARNGLSDTVIAQFKEAYPDLVLTTAGERAAFVTANPDIVLHDGPNGTKVVSGIDRVDLWVGGLAEKHINDGVVGQTFWVVLHEQLDRLQEGDRFYYLDRFDNFDFYQNQVDGQTFSDIVTRNTGLTGLQEDIFAVSNEDAQPGGGTGAGTGTDVGTGTGTGTNDGTGVGGGGTGTGTGDDTGTGGTTGGSTGADDGTGTQAGSGTGSGTGSGGTTGNGAGAGGTAGGASGNGAGSGTGSGGTTGGTSGNGSGNDHGTGGHSSDDDDGTDVAENGDDSHQGGTTGGATTGGGTVGGTTGGGTATPPAELPASLVAGTAGDDVLSGTSGADTILGLSGDDHIFAADGADVIRGGDGNDFVDAGAGRDVVFGGAGDDDILAGAGDDMLYGDGGADRILAGAGNDLVTAGAGNDAVIGGDGDDLFVAEVGDGNDSYWGDEVGGGTGSDTLDMSAITANITANLGTGLAGRGSVTSAQSGSDTLWGVENIVTGSGDDHITASDAVNVMDGGLGADIYHFQSAAAANGDTIASFQPGDRIDLSGIDANQGVAGNQAFTLATGAAFTGVGQLLVTQESRADGDYTIVAGNTGGDAAPEFKFAIKGTPAATAADFTL